MERIFLGRSFVLSVTFINSLLSSIRCFHQFVAFINSLLCLAAIKKRANSFLLQKKLALLQKSSLWARKGYQVKIVGQEGKVGD